MMDCRRGKWAAGLRCAAPSLLAAAAFAVASVMASAERDLPQIGIRESEREHLLSRVVNFLWNPDDSSYHHVWPVREVFSA